MRATLETDLGNYGQQVKDLNGLLQSQAPFNNEGLVDETAFGTLANF